MRRGGGKQKGAAFERKICEQLSRMIQPDTDETLFWRSAMSGGRSTVQHKKGKRNTTQSGDITCVHPDGNWLTAHFFIEAKFYRNLQIQSALLEDRGALANFWRIACNQAQRHKKHPMLIARENRTRTLLLLTPAGHKSLTTFRGALHRQLVDSILLDALIFDYESLIKG